MTWARTMPDWPAAWQHCPRGDWVIAMAVRAGVERPLLVHAACSCAREVLGQLGPERGAAQAAIEATEAWVAAQGPSAQLPWSSSAEQSARLAECDRAADGACDPATAAAVHAASLAARSVLDGDLAIGAAAAAVEAITFSAGDCAMLEALRFAQRKTADLARASIPLDAVLGALARAS